VAQNAVSQSQLGLVARARFTDCLWTGLQPGCMSSPSARFASCDSQSGAECGSSIATWSRRQGSIHRLPLEGPAVKLPVQSVRPLRKLRMTEWRRMRFLNRNLVSSPGLDSQTAFGRPCSQAASPVCLPASQVVIQEWRRMRFFNRNLKQAAKVR
jgi:hypothetical protein